MSREYIVMGEPGTYLTQRFDWSGEYPNARLFPNLQAARRAVDNYKPPLAKFSIYETRDYAQGRAPVVQS